MVIGELRGLWTWLWPICVSNEPSLPRTVKRFTFKIDWLSSSSTDNNCPHGVNQLKTELHCNGLPSSLAKWITGQRHVFYFLEYSTRVLLLILPRSYTIYIYACYITQSIRSTHDFELQHQHTIINIKVWCMLFKSRKSKISSQEHLAKETVTFSSFHI